MCWDSSSSSIFQSTLSVRRATRLMLMAWLRLDISIHALRKESDCRPCLIVVGDIISIHALRKESDLSEAKKGVHPSAISIHALRKESDQALLRYTHCA